MSMIGSVYRVEPGHHVHMNRGGEPMLGNHAKVATAWHDGFRINLYKLPRWLEVRADLTVESRHPDGRHLFATTVLRIEKADDGYEIVLSQPTAAQSLELRRSRRVDVEGALLWSRLDEDGHPGIEHDGVLMNLSATGLRFRCTSFNLEVGERLMFSLGLADGRVNVPGTVVGVGEGLFLGEVRVDFGSLDVARRRELVEVVAAHRAEAPDEVLSAHGMLSDRITRARAAYGA